MKIKPLYVIKFGDLYYDGMSNLNKQLRHAKVYISIKMAEDIAKYFVEKVKKVERYDKYLDNIKDGYTIVEIEMYEKSK